MENSFEERERIERARKKVKSIKGFYRHLTVYLFVNAFLWVLHIINMEPGESFWQWGNFTTAFFGAWGCYFMVQVFLAPTFFFGSDWEERKLKEILDKNRKTKKENRWE